MTFQDFIRIIEKELFLKLYKFKEIIILKFYKIAKNVIFKILLKFLSI